MSAGVDVAFPSQGDVSMTAGAHRAFRVAAVCGRMVASVSCWCDISNTCNNLEVRQVGVKVKRIEFRYNLNIRNQIKR